MIYAWKKKKKSEDSYQVVRRSENHYDGYYKKSAKYAHLSFDLSHL